MGETESRRFRSCHVIAGINRNVGGPAVTVPHLADALAERGDDSLVLTMDYPWEGPLPQLKRARIECVSRGPWTRRMGGWCPELKLRLRLIARGGVDVIHNHGHWLFPNGYAREIATEFKIPLVISPRGMLEDWSLRRSRLKKWAMWQLSESYNVQAAAAFHATSDTEAEAIRKLGLSQPIAVIPNGVDLPNLDALPERQVLEEKFPELREMKWLLFMARLHPKKGLIELAKAWGQLANAFPEWKLVIAGPDEGDFQREVEMALAASGGDQATVFTGMLAGREKSAALAHAELFILPTHSENFGLAVAEALAHGCPAVVSKGAPWPELESARCGWWFELREDRLRETLGQAMNLSPVERRAMGARGRELAGEKFSWDRVGEEMSALYRWLCDSGERPACVQVVT